MCSLFVYCLFVCMLDIMLLLLFVSMFCFICFYISIFYIFVSYISYDKYIFMLFLTWVLGAHKTWPKVLQGSQVLVPKRVVIILVCYVLCCYRLSFSYYCIRSVYLLFLFHKFYAEILHIRAKFQTAMVSCSRLIWITNSNDHRRVWTANLLHTK